LIGASLAAISYLYMVCAIDIPATRNHASIPIPNIVNIYHRIPHHTNIVTTNSSLDATICLSNLSNRYVPTIYKSITHTTVYISHIPIDETIIPVWVICNALHSPTKINNDNISCVVIIPNACLPYNDAKSHWSCKSLTTTIVLDNDNAPDTNSILYISYHTIYNHTQDKTNVATTCIHPITKGL
jgi:hypothetical protein